MTRSLDHKIVLYVTTETMRKKLLEYNAVKIVKRNGKEVWKSKGRPYMRCLDDLEIISQYNSEIVGFYNYYSIANNSPVIDSFYNIMEYSMYKTYAGKYSTSKKKIIAKYKKTAYSPYRTQIRKDMRSGVSFTTRVSNARNCRIEI